MTIWLLIHSIYVLVALASDCDETVDTRTVVLLQTEPVRLNRVLSHAFNSSVNVLSASSEWSTSAKYSSMAYLQVWDDIQQGFFSSMRATAASVKKYSANANAKQNQGMALISLSLLSTSIATIVCLLAFLLIFGIPAQWPSMEEPPKDGVPTTLVALAFGFMAVLNGSTAQYSPSIPVMARDFGVSDLDMAATISVNFLARAIASCAMGPLSDRIGRKPCLIGGMSLLAVSIAACGFAQNWELFMVSRCLQGFAESADTVVLAAVLDSSRDEKDYYTSFSVVSIGMMLGPILGPGIGGFLANWLGWRSGFFVLAAVLAILIAISCHCFVERAPRYQGVCYREHAKLVLFDWGRCRLLVGAALCEAAVFGVTPNISTLMEDIFHTTELQVSAAMMVVAISFVAGMHLSRRLTSCAFESVKILSTYSTLTAILLLLSGVCFDSSLGIILISICLVFWGLGGTFCAADTLFMVSCEKEAGMAQGIKQTLCYLASSASTLVGAALLKKPGKVAVRAFVTYDASLLACMCLVLKIFCLNPPESSTAAKDEQFTNSLETT